MKFRKGQMTITTLEQARNYLYRKYRRDYSAITTLEEARRYLRKQRCGTKFHMEKVK